MIWYGLSYIVPLKYAIRLKCGVIRLSRIDVPSVQSPKQLSTVFSRVQGRAGSGAFSRPFCLGLRVLFFRSPFLLFSTLSLIPSLPPVFPFLLILRRLCCTGSDMLGT